MPLSEHEQRLLDQMEQALYDDDPKFVSRLAEDPARTHTRKRMIIGGAVVLAGLALIVLGVASQLIWLGGIGFAVMVAGGGYALTPGEKRAGLGTVGDDGSVTPHRRSKGFGRRRGGTGGSTGATPSRSLPGVGGSQGSFMQRMEDRWEKRRRSDEW